MSKIKPAARTVLWDEKNNKIAIIEVKNEGYYKIPGGGIEDNETPEAAALREAMEEAGCEVELLDKLGESDFTDPINPELTHHSVCFLAKVKTNHQTVALTQEEKDRDFQLLWVEPNEAIKLFEQVSCDSIWGKEINARDLKFIKLAEIYFTHENKIPIN